MFWQRKTLQEIMAITRIDPVRIWSIAREYGFIRRNDRFYHEPTIIGWLKEGLTPEQAAKRSGLPVAIALDIAVRLRSKAVLELLKRGRSPAEAAEELGVSEDMALRVFDANWEELQEGVQWMRDA